MQLILITHSINPISPHLIAYFNVLYTSTSWRKRTCARNSLSTWFSITLLIIDRDQDLLVKAQRRILLTKSQKPTGESLERCSSTASWRYIATQSSASQVYNIPST